jgi:hypothetical protein
MLGFALLYPFRVIHVFFNRKERKVSAKSAKNRKSYIENSFVLRKLKWRAKRRTDEFSI